MNKVYGFLFLSALILSSPTLSRAAGRLEQQIAFAAMQRNDPALTQAVQTVVATGFLSEIVHIVQSGQQEQGDTCDTAAAGKVSKIKCFVKEYLINEHAVSFSNGRLEAKKYNLRFRKVQWEPGQRQAKVFHAFRVRNPGGGFMHCNGSVKVDLKLWQITDASNCND